MTERWVKATRHQTKDDLWVNMAKIIAIDVDGGITQLGDDLGMVFMVVEPPEHFLPHSPIITRMALDFLLHVADIPEGAASGDGLVREAQRVRNRIRSLG